MMQKRIRRYLYSGLLTLSFVTPLCQAETYLYRYENEEGVKVLNHTIPPKYAQKGYEILSPAGQFIRKVAPAPTDGDVAKENSVRALREKFAILKRRYSSPRDIEAAKIRRLAGINTNISIIRGNIGSINIRIENLMSQAADAERSGTTVTPELLQRLGDTHAELSVSEDSLKIRLDEYQKISDRYDGDLGIFAQGAALAESGNLN